MAAGRHPPTFDRIARSSWRQALSGFITINSTNTNSVYKPDRDPDLCHRQLQHDAKGVARSGGCSPSSAAGHSASLEDEAALSERGGEGRRWVVVGRLPGGQWMSAFGTTQVVSEVVAWGPSVQLSQGLSLLKASLTNLACLQIEKNTKTLAFRS